MGKGIAHGLMELPLKDRGIMGTAMALALLPSAMAGIIRASGGKIGRMAVGRWRGPMGGSILASLTKGSSTGKGIVPGKMRGMRGI
jgi:hypothetical protein